MCLIQGIKSICDGTTCVSLDLTDTMGPATLTAMGEANIEKFYQRLEKFQIPQIQI